MNAASMTAGAAMSCPAPQSDHDRLPHPPRESLAEVPDAVVAERADPYWQEQEGPVLARRHAKGRVRRAAGAGPLELQVEGA